MIARTVKLAWDAARVGGWRTLAEKVQGRLFPPKDDELEAVRRWCEAKAESFADWAKAQDAALWQEATDFEGALRERARDVLAKSNISFGGGAVTSPLYFLVRLLKPTTVVETGVAAGWSSTAFLSALEANGGDGTLWSSDFPYLGQEGAADEIGVLVPEGLRSRWRLFKRGDHVNLPEIVAACGPIGLFHYDSQKSYAGREFAYDMVKPKLTPNAVAVFDDILNNAHFMDLEKQQPVRVFGWTNRYTGAIGLG